MGDRRRKGVCGRKKRERGRVGGRAVEENLLGGSLPIEGGSMRKRKWEEEGTSRKDQEDIGAMNTNIGIHEFGNKKCIRE